MHYHKNDMEDLKRKTSGKQRTLLSLKKYYCLFFSPLQELKGCQAKLVERELELSYNIQRVKELEQNLREALTHRAKYILNQPLIFVITPTYKRWTQKADLTQLCQTLSHISNLRWIVIEDSEDKTSLVTSLLSRCPVNSTHLNFRTSLSLLNIVNSTENKKPQVKKPRGIEQRNAALKWLRRQYRHGEVKGVVYFADDDNTYDLRVFDEVKIKISQYFTHAFIRPLLFLFFLKDAHN